MMIRAPVYICVEKPVNDMVYDTNTPSANNA